MECRRIETLINWKKNQFSSKQNYQSRKVVIKNVYNKEEESDFVDAVKKGYVVVIKKKIGTNKSENLLNSVVHWVIVDYLANLRRYLTPELTTSLVYREIISKLGEIKDFEAQKKFIQGIIKDKKVEELMEKLDDLETEGLLNHLYIPYLRQLKKYKITQTQKIKRESEELLYWLNDYEDRLIGYTNFKYFPRISFLYVKMLLKDESDHIRRAIEKFEKQKCEFVMVSGWIEQKNSLEYVSNLLNRNYGYFHGEIFSGQRLHGPKGQETYRNRINRIHAKNRIIYNNVFNVN